mmetsp:Transcript_29607/g.66994  ORF Transcript_29607/g.66994 Transcript_29607/m.66994 type:complete len:225 (-) Transcript_29607:513-1187(-)
MFLALLAYFKVFKLSSELLSTGLTHAIMSVREFPPKLSCSILVSLESRYGTCTECLFCSSPRADMTFPSASNPEFMLMPSFNRSPSALVFFNRSLPAKSTKWNFETIYSSSATFAPSSVPATSLGFSAIRKSLSRINRCSIINVKIACDLLECAFISVLPTARRAVPCSKSSHMSLKLSTSRSSAPAKYIPPWGSSRICNVARLAPIPKGRVLGIERRSLSSSL